MLISPKCTKTRNTNCVKEDLCIKCVVKSKLVHTSEKQKLLSVVKLHILSLSGWIRPVIYSVQRWPFKCSWHLGNCPFCSPISFYFTAFFLLNAISPFSVHLHLVDLSCFHFSFPVSSSSTTLRLLVGKISFFSFSVPIPCQVLLKCWHFIFLLEVKSIKCCCSILKWLVVTLIFSFLHRWQKCFWPHLDVWAVNALVFLLYISCTSCVNHTAQPLSDLLLFVCFFCTCSD